MKMMQQGHAAVAVSANARRMLEWLNLTSIGTMGWMFRTFCVRANGPIPKLLLFWTGTLMSLATGFWTAFCKLCCSITSGVACDEDACCAAGGVSAQRKHQ